MKLIAAISTFLMFLGGIFGTKDFVSSYNEGSLTFLQAEEHTFSMTDKIEATKDRRIALLKEKQEELTYDWEMFSRAPLDDREWKKMQADMHLEEEQNIEEITLEEATITEEESLLEETSDDAEDIISATEKIDIEESATEALDEPPTEVLTASTTDEIILMEATITADREENTPAVLESLETIDLSSFDASMFSRAPLDYDFESIEAIDLEEELSKKDKKKNKKK